MAEPQNWKNAWPWGRKMPEDRMAELKAEMEELDRRERLFELRVGEMRIDFERKREQLELDMGIAQKCAGDRVRREILFYTWKLEGANVDVSGVVNSHAGQALIDELKKLWEDRLLEGVEDDGKEQELSSADIDEMVSKLLGEPAIDGKEKEDGKDA